MPPQPLQPDTFTADQNGVFEEGEPQIHLKAVGPTVADGIHDSECTLCHDAKAWFAPAMLRGSNATPTQRSQLFACPGNTQEREWMLPFLNFHRRGHLSSTMAIPSSPFGPLHLSCTDTAWLQELVRLLVHEHVLGYEKFVHQDQRLLDPTQWKRNTQRDNLQVFCQQPILQRKNSSAGERGSRRRLFKARRDTEVGAALAEMPTLLLVGTIKGSLNDVMYGVLNPTADSMRVKSSYVGDKFASCAVLATIERPTPSDPFRSHTLKWFEGDHPYIFRPIVKNRDFVFMEATGIIQLAGGDRVGYHVMHSVTFPGAREMNGNIRAHMAVCAFYRQLSDGVVEVFTKTTANPGGQVAPAIAVKYGATALLSAQNLVDCAQAKKLAWAVSSRARSASTTSTCSSSSSISSSGRSTTPTREFRADSGGVCFNCGESTSLLSRSAVCTLCTRPICAACRVKKSLRSVAWTGGVTKHKMKFCGPCATEAMRLDAQALACEEFGADRPAQRHSNHRNRLTAHLEGLTASDPNVVVLRPSALSS